MNYKVLKRPMFRIGGGVDSQGTGITSGMDTPRKNYSHGGAHDYGYYKDLIPEMFTKQKKALEGYKGLIAGTTLIKGAEPLRNVQSIWDIPGAVGSPEMLSAIGEGLISQKGVDVKIGQAGLEEAVTMAKLTKPKDETYMFEERLGKARTIRKLIRNHIAEGGEPGDEEVQDWEDDISYLLGTETLEDFLIQASISQGVLFDRKSSIAQWYEIKGLEKKAEGGVVGRKNYQEGVGPNIMGEGQNVMQGEGAAIQDQTIQPPVQQGQPGQQDPYQILRQRLPAEVPDEVVRLIAYNKEAFQDFANIQTQDDVTAFNDKYGVSLVIDVGSV